MNKPKICCVIRTGDIAKIKDIGNLVDLFEVRIDLIGDQWTDVVKHLKRPWIACNRDHNDGGKWAGDEKSRVAELFRALDLGADIIDIETGAQGLREIVNLIKRKAKCLISFHDWKETPSGEILAGIIQQQINSGADICKVITTANRFEDNITTLNLLKQFPKIKMVAFAMGTPGIASRILSPLAGGYFTYASIKEGSESAPGQLTVQELRSIYRMLEKC
ncbi:MAG: type I 3-dehydroquinate dehydratase [Chloroflexi bacterium]|nr:type I 3-dehydroquinate dehydratase [Chloroflexota bacterium]